WHSAIGGVWVTVMVKLWVGLVSTPPFNVPPLSLTLTVRLAMPVAPAADVYVSVPSAATAGAAEKSAPLSFVSTKVRICPASFAGPALRFVAHPGTDCAPAFLT